MAASALARRAAEAAARRLEHAGDDDRSRGAAPRRRRSARISVRSVRSASTGGTFEGLTDEPLDEPPAVLARQREARGLARSQFDVMAIGEVRRLR